jgi:hypothetical protein
MAGGRLSQHDRAGRGIGSLPTAMFNTPSRAFWLAVVLRAAGSRP